MTTKNRQQKQMQDKLMEHKHYIDQHGQDLPEIRNRKWSLAETKNGETLVSKVRLPQLKQIKGIQNAHSTQ